MEYMPDSSSQLLSFLYSAGLGFALGIVYDLIRIIFFMITGSDKKFRMASDIIFISICLCMTFIYLLVMCSGQILLYAIVGEAIGFALFYFLISKLFFNKFLEISIKIRKPLAIFLCFLLEKIGKIHYFLQNKINFSKKREKFSQKGLHIRHKIVYNHPVKLYYRGNIERNRGDESGKEKS